MVNAAVLEPAPAAAGRGRGRSSQPRIAVVPLVVGVGTLIGLTVWGQFESTTATSLLVLDVVVGVVAVALLPLLIRWPVVATLAATVLAAVSPAATPTATVGTLNVAQRRRFVVAAAVAGVGICAHVVRAAWRPVHGLPFVWWVVLVVVSYAALVGWGTLSQARRALIESLRQRAELAEAEQADRVAQARALERTRIAREMHDVLAHRLSLLATYAGAIEYRPDAPPEQLARAAGVIREGAHQALDELREVITLLRDDDPVGERPQPGLGDISRLVEESRMAGTWVDLKDSVSDPDDLPETLGRTAYRVVQEALTNARKHAPNEPVSVVLEGGRGAGLAVDVTNPMPAAGARSPSAPGSGTGLVGLSERVALAGGRLEHGATAGGEFRLYASLPWAA